MSASSIIIRRFFVKVDKWTTKRGRRRSGHHQYVFPEWSAYYARSECSRTVTTGILGTRSATDRILRGAAAGGLAIRGGRIEEEKWGRGRRSVGEGLLVFILIVVAEYVCLCFCYYLCSTPLA